MSERECLWEDVLGKSCVCRHKEKSFFLLSLWSFSLFYFAKHFWLNLPSRVRESPCLFVKGKRKEKLYLDNFLSSCACCLNRERREKVIFFLATANQRYLLPQCKDCIAEEAAKNFNFPNNSPWFIIFMFRYQSSSCMAWHAKIYIKDNYFLYRANYKSAVLAVQ